MVVSIITVSYFVSLLVPTGSPSHGGSLLTPFYSVLVSVSVFRALSTVFHSINSPHNSLLSHSVLLVLLLPYWSFQPYHLLMKVSLSPDIILLWLTGLKASTNNNNNNNRKGIIITVTSVIVIVNNNPGYV